MTTLRGLAVSLALLVFVLWTGTARAEKSGKDLFVEKKCNKCHSIDAEKIAKKEEPGEAEEEGEEAGGKEEKKPPDLSGVGKKHDADWITGWLQKKIKTDKGKKHKGKFKGTDEELKTLVTWLSGLKTGGK